MTWHAQRACSKYFGSLGKAEEYDKITIANLSWMMWEHIAGFTLDVKRRETSARLICGL